MHKAVLISFLMLAAIPTVSSSEGFFTCSWSDVQGPLGERDFEVYDTFQDCDNSHPHEASGSTLVLECYTFTSGSPPPVPDSVTVHLSGAIKLDKDVPCTGEYRSYACETNGEVRFFVSASKAPHLPLVGYDATPSVIGGFSCTL